VQSQLLQELTKEDILPLLEHLDPDDVTDLLQTLPKKKQEELLVEMSQDLQDSLTLLLQFDPKTAAGLMSLNYVQVDGTQRLSEVAEEVQRHEKRTGKLPIVLVLDEGEPVKFLPLQELLFAKPGDRVRDLAKPIKTISHLTSSDKVISQFLEHPHEKIAVMGENGRILGVLYSDDVLRELEQREASTLYDFAGLSSEESITDSIKMKVLHRYRWLIINLGTAFLAAFTVGLFDKTISKNVLLAVYMPIVAGMGGNAATQTLAILVRGISLKQIDLQTAMPTLRREMGAALVNGIINGLIVFAIVATFNHNIGVATVLGIAMITNLLVASFFGTLVPLIMKRLGKDPATSATIFITTATDVLGFLAFLGLASLLL
jgi:magnesium transporter